MKHINNSLDRNVDLSNIPEYEPDYSPKSLQTERIIVILLIIVGIIGAYYTFKFGFKSTLSKTTSQITKNVLTPVLEANLQIPIKQENVFEKISSNTQLKIDGINEANQKMKFTIESFDKKAKYNLIMGDGKVLHPRSKTIEYTYQNPGKYHVQLKVSYNGKSKKIYSDKIEILESIAVAPSAHQEY